VLVTSKMPFGRWGEVFGDDVVASAMFDRVVHHAEALNSAVGQLGADLRPELRALILCHHRPRTCLVPSTVTPIAICAALFRTWCPSRTLTTSASK